MYNYNSKYTVYFRDILLSNPDFTQSCFPSVQLGQLINIDYLCNAFNGKFMNRQIGYETVEQFKAALKSAFYTYLPALSLRIKGLELMYIKDVTVEYTETEQISRVDNGTIKTDGTDSNVSSSTGNTTTNTNTQTENRFSDTPQNSVSNLDNYITSAERNSGTTQNTQNQSSNANSTLSRKSNTNSNMDSNTIRTVSGVHGDFYQQFYSAADEIISIFLTKFNQYFLSLFG